MVLVRFKSEEDHEYLLKKVKKMKKFAEELEDCLEEAIEEGEADFRGGRYRDEDDYEDESRMRGGRYGYRRGGSRMR
jgi:hypothetical protein